MQFCFSLLRYSKSVMYEEVLKSIDRIKEVIDRSEKKFMYAENFVYTPCGYRSRTEIIRKKKIPGSYPAKGEESLKGSSSPVAGEWSKTGGDRFIRTGAHPLSAILWLKRQEALTRGEEIMVSPHGQNLRGQQQG